MSRAVIAAVFPSPSERYERQNEAEFRRVLEQTLKQCVVTQSIPTVTGAKGGNAALASLITALAGLGWIVDGTT